VQQCSCVQIFYFLIFHVRSRAGCALDDADSNFKACQDAFFDKVSLPRENILTIEDYSNPDHAAQLYEDRLQHVLGDRPIDMVLLGLGPDGHTASLFPGHELLQYTGDRNVVPIFDSPKPPSCRITLTLGTINNSREVVFIATGEGKAQRLQDILSPNEETVSSGVIYPPSLVKPARLSWLIDAPAAALIKTHPNMSEFTQDTPAEL
jgi:6-phosphogluconolactonase